MSMNRGRGSGLGRQDENDGQQASKPTNSFGSLLKWAPVVVAAAAGAGLAYKAAKKEAQMEIDEDAFHKYFETFSKERQDNKVGLDYIVKCLSHEHISCNKHNPNGFAPMHLACREGNITAFQAVLPFHPNMQLKSACGKTPFQLLQEAKFGEKNSERVKELSIIEYMLQAVDDGVASSIAEWPMNQPEPGSPTARSSNLQGYKIGDQTFTFFNPDPTKVRAQSPGPGTQKVRALCIDGGGTRGFVPLEFLEFIENWSPLPDPLPEERLTIKKSFDWIAGTSTGGIIALYLALGHTVAECRRLYFLLKDKIFTGSKPYNAEKYEKELQVAFGENRMRDITGIKCAITATSGSAERLTSVLFTNYDEKTRDEFIWKVARMSSSAPYFFNPYLHSDGKYYYDGGLTANNPTQALLSEITRLKENLTNGIVVSLGTGKPPVTENINLNFSSRMGIVGVLGSALKTLINQVCQSDGECITYAMTTCSLANCSYYRLTPTLPEDIVLDETDNEKLLNMIYHTKAYVKLYKINMMDMCERLMAVTEEKGSCSIV